MSVRGNPFHTKWNLEQGSIPMSGELDGVIPDQGPWNVAQGEIPGQSMSSNFGSQAMMQQ